MSAVEDPMGEGRNPEKELVGWANFTLGGIEEASDVPVNMVQKHWKKNPKARDGKPLIVVGETEKKKIPVYLSEDEDGDALQLAAQLLDRKSRESTDGNASE